MAHPLFIIEQALRQFSSQWYVGLRPSLEILTKYDGSLVVNSKMIYSNRPAEFNRPENGAPQFQYTSTPRSKRARKNARYRRNKARSMKDVETQFSNNGDGASINEPESRPSANVETQFSINDNEKVDSGFMEDSRNESIGYTCEKATQALGKVPFNPSDAGFNQKDEIFALDDSVTPIRDVVLLNSSAAEHDCKNSQKKNDGTLENCGDAQVIVDYGEKQCTSEEGALNIEAKKVDSGFKVTNTDVASNSLEGMVFLENNVTSVSSEASSNSIVASYHCESCLKEFDKAMEHFPENLTCEDCCKAIRTLDPNEGNCCEENPPRCSSCTKENLCHGCEEAMEKLFRHLITLNELGMTKNTRKKARKMRREKYTCPICTFPSLLKSDCEWEMFEVLILLIDSRTVLDLPCKECM